MGVDGRLKMACDDHRAQGGKLDFLDPKVLAESDEELTLLVWIESSLYGRRHGIATSRKQAGGPTEKAHPWEVAERSAIGRALAAFGYGLLPGGETAEETPPRQNRRQDRPAGGQGQAVRLSERQQAYLVNAYSRSHGIAAAEATEALNALCQERYGHDFSECTPNEGREISLSLPAGDQRQLDNPPADNPSSSSTQLAASPPATAPPAAPKPKNADELAEALFGRELLEGRAEPAPEPEPQWAEKVRKAFRDGHIDGLAETFIALGRVGHWDSTTAWAEFNKVSSAARKDPAATQENLDDLLRSACEARARGEQPAS
jgi:hypothetical protein